MAASALWLCNIFCRNLTWIARQFFIFEKAETACFLAKLYLVDSKILKRLLCDKSNYSGTADLLFSISAAISAFSSGGMFSSLASASR